MKDAHLVRALKKYAAQLLTEKTRRAKLGEKVEKTSAEVSKRAADSHAEIEKAQIKKEKKSEKKVEKVEKIEDEKIEAKSSDDVKVKKVEKKGLFSRKNKTEKDS